KFTAYPMRQRLIEARANPGHFLPIFALYSPALLSIAPRSHLRLIPSMMLKMQPEISPHKDYFLYVISACQHGHNTLHLP
ncbi:hypothetical protein, partial [Kosakonia sp. BK9b]